MALGIAAWLEGGEEEEDGFPVCWRPVLTWLELTSRNLPY